MSYFYFIFDGNTFPLVALPTIERKRSLTINSLTKSLNFPIGFNKTYIPDLQFVLQVLNRNQRKEDESRVTRVPQNESKQ